MEINVATPINLKAMCGVISLVKMDEFEVETICISIVAQLYVVFSSCCGFLFDY